MPWKATNKLEQRFDLVRRMALGRVTVVELCQEFGITRQTAYKWEKRYRAGRLRGLQERSRRPLKMRGQTSLVWRRRVRRLRQRWPTWGACKLHYVLGERYGPKGVPATATISRWLKGWGLARGRRRRLAGPSVLRKALHVPVRCHEVWTVDFKGWYRTGDGRRVEPLTVRDLYSRYGLGIRLLRNNGVETTRREFVKLFQEHGLPERIRCDNGTPFGAVGGTGFSRLSAWWVRLGIMVEFSRPGCPSDNGAHEQFHRIYKAEVARNPERTLRAQQERSSRWLEDYNRRRPHEGLGMKRPVELYQKNRRRLKRRLGPWKYPRDWERRWVKGSGELNREGQRHYIGEAFVRNYVGLKPVSEGKWKVYFGPLLVGELHEQETGRIRMARYR